METDIPWRKPRKRLEVRVGEELYGDAQRVAQAQHITMQQLLWEALEEKVNGYFWQQERLDKYVREWAKRAGAELDAIAAKQEPPVSPG
jgi:hypothetical protein